MSVNGLKKKLRLGAAFLEDRDGAAAIVIAFMTPILIGGLAYGAEIGAWEMTKRRIQNAADTAAYAAGTQVRSGYDAATIEKAALQVATDSGFKSGAAGITVANPPTSAPVTVDGTDPNGDARFVHVILTETVRRNFTRYFTSGSTINIVSESVARVENGRPACVLSLSPNSSGAVSASGATTVTLGGCDIAANSLASDAFDMNGSAQVEADCVTVVGGASSTGNLTLNDCNSPIENAPVTADPYRFVAQPSGWSGCKSTVDLNKFNTNNKKTGNPKPTFDIYGNTGGTITGEAYCGGGNIHGTTNLDPGVYVLAGGNWKVNSGATFSGDGVTLFLTCLTATDCATLDISGGANIDLSAPLTGPYAGLVVFFDRANTGSSKINGGSNFSMVGAVYGASQAIDFTGNTAGSGPGECTQVIGYTVSFSGSADFDTDCSNSGTKEIKTAQSIQIVR